jgi:Na+-driven multidrug efflux pump
MSRHQRVWNMGFFLLFAHAIIRGFFRPADIPEIAGYVITYLWILAVIYAIVWIRDTYEIRRRH